MKYRPLGRTGLHVSCLGFGAQNFGGADHPLYGKLGAIDARTADRILGRLIDAGVNLIDTADSYGDGAAESMLGDALRGRRHAMLLSTKVGNRTGLGANDAGLSRPHIMRSVEASLGRLGTDHIDIYFLHNFDPVADLEGVLRSCDDLVRQGKVRHVGCSNFAAYQIERACGIAALRQIEPLACIQAYYSLLGRDIEREVAPLAVDRSLPVIAWGALAGGFLSGKFSPTGASAGDDARRRHFDFPPIDVERGHAIVAIAAQIARRLEATVAQVALAWQFSRPFIASSLFGARDEAQLEDNLKAATLELTAPDICALDEASELTPE